MGVSSDWKSGHSAKALAYCWEKADGLPLEIARLFENSGVDSFRKLELLLAFPEYKVLLRGSGPASQNDLFVLAKTADDQILSITVEGKVSEPFGETVGEWHIKKSQNRKSRLAFLQEQLGLAKDIPSHIRYQLLHRTASAVLEAVRFNARRAAMIVHSFSRQDEGFNDYREFLSLFGVRAVPDKLLFLVQTHNLDLYSGWANGSTKWLSV